MKEISHDKIVSTTKKLKKALRDYVRETFSFDLFSKSNGFYAVQYSDGDVDMDDILEIEFSFDYISPKVAEVICEIGFFTQEKGHAMDRAYFKEQFKKFNIQDFFVCASRTDQAIEENHVPKVPTKHSKRYATSEIGLIFRLKVI